MGAAIEPEALPNPPQRWRSFNRVCAYGLASILALAGTALGFASLRGELAYFSLAFLFVAPFLCVLIHECGHALAALAVGRRVHVIHVLPFGWRLRPFALRLTGRFDGPDAAGFMLAAPKNGEPLKRHEDIIVSLGGPLASWTLAALCLAAPWTVAPALGWARAPSYPADPTYVAQLLLVSVGLVALGDAVISTWPFHQRDGAGNDAAHILERSQEPARIANDPLAYARVLWGMGIAPHQFDDWIKAGLAQPEADPHRAWLKAYFVFVDGVVRGDADIAHRGAGQMAETFGQAAETRIAQAYSWVTLDGRFAEAEDHLANTAYEPEDTYTSFIGIRSLTIIEIMIAAGDIQDAATRLRDLKRDVAGRPGFPEALWAPALRRAQAHLRAAKRAKK